MGQPQSSSGPDWNLIGGGIAAAATIAGAIWAGMRGAFRNGKAKDHDELRLQRDKAATENSAVTLQRVSWLVDTMQEELKRKAAELNAQAAELIETERRCRGRESALLTKIGEHEASLSVQRIEIEGLKREIRGLKSQ